MYLIYHNRNQKLQKIIKTITNNCYKVKFWGKHFVKDEGSVEVRIDNLYGILKKPTIVIELITVMRQRSGRAFVLS